MAKMTEEAYLLAGNLARIRIAQLAMSECTFMDDIEDGTARAIRTQLSMLAERVGNKIETTE